jgi:hypothetical protein
MFHNAAEFDVLYPDAAPAEGDSYFTLLAEGEAALTGIRAALLERAESLGRVSRDPDLHLIVDGTELRSETEEAGVHRFAVPAGACDIVIASRSVVPTETEADSLDPRWLGVPLQSVVLSGNGLRIEISQDCAALIDGFHTDEGSHRWTDGRAAIPAGLLANFAEGLSLEVQLGQLELHYPVELPAAPAQARPIVARAARGRRRAS